MKVVLEWMHTILNLIPVSPETERYGQELLAEDFGTIIRDYQKIAEEIPNFHDFLTKVRETYDSSVANIIWFRIWSEIKCEERMGFQLTLPLLRTMAHYEDRAVEFKRDTKGKTLTHCLKVLHALVSTADKRYEQTA